MRRPDPVTRLGLAIVRVLLPEDQRDDFVSELVREAEAHDRGWMRRQLLASMLPLALRVPSRLTRGTWDDARQARRALAGDAHTTFLVIATLGLGLGASAVVFGVLRSVALAPLPYPDAEQLYLLRSVQPLRSAEARGVSGPDYHDFEAALGGIPTLGVFDLTTATVSGVAALPMKVERAATNTEAFAIVGLSPLIGRTFSAEEDGAEPRRVALLSEPLWRSAFGADRGVLDRTIEIDGVSHVVIGVMPTEFALPDGQTAVWTPLGDSPRGLHRRAPVLDVLVRVADPARVGALAEQLEAESQRLADAYPETNEGRVVSVEPLADVLAGEDGRSLHVLMWAALALMGVAYLNTLGLLVSRTLVRTPELRLRSALGAARHRVERQLLLELAAMASASAGLGIALAAFGLGEAARRIPADTFRATEVGLDSSVVLFVLASAPLMTLAGAVVPRFASGAFDASRDRSSRAELRPVARLGVLAAQLSTVVILVGASLALLRTFADMSRVDRGVDIEALEVAQVDLPPERYPTGMAQYPEWPEVHEFHRLVLDGLSAERGIESAALAGSNPIRRAGFRLGMPLRTRSVVDTVEAAIQMVSHGWRPVFGLDLMSGRDLDDRDTADNEAVVVVNDAFRRAWLAGQLEPAGFVTYLGTERRIVGVVEDIIPAPGVEAQPTVFAPMAQTPSESITIVVRPVPGIEPSDAIRRVIAGIDREVALFGEASLADALGAALARPALNATVIGVFGLLALIIAGVGTFALVSHLAASMMRSLGIRVALGAGRVAVLRAVLRDTTMALGISLAVGITGLVALGPFLNRLAPDTGTLDLPTISIAGLVLVIAAAIAATPPALKAVRVDPARSLRDG